MFLFAENGLVMFLWIGINVNPTWVQNVFSVQSAAQIDIDRVRNNEVMRVSVCEARIC